MPNWLWHPAPQYAAVEPQNPFSEQQFPNVLVKQVEFLSELDPQFPSVLVGESRDRTRLEAVSENVAGVEEVSRVTGLRN